MLTGLHTSRVAVLAALCASSCTFGSSGDGPNAVTLGAAETTQGSTTDGGAPATSGGQAGDDARPRPGTLTTPTADGGSDANDDSDADSVGDGESSTGTPVACGEPPALLVEIVLATDAVVSAPMEARPIPALPGGECIASDVLGGNASFLWTAPCDDEYFVWAYVWDDRTGSLNTPSDPDTFGVTVDSGTQLLWHYGCQTWKFANPQWRWLQILDAIECFSPTPFKHTLEAGSHSLNFRNGETGAYDVSDPPGPVAAIARVLITNDPSYVPGAGD